MGILFSSPNMSQKVHRLDVYERKSLFSTVVSMMSSTRHLVAVARTESGKCYIIEMASSFWDDFKENYKEYRSKDKYRIVLMPEHQLNDKSWELLESKTALPEGLKLQDLFDAACNGGRDADGGRSDQQAADNRERAVQRMVERASLRYDNNQHFELQRQACMTMVMLCVVALVLAGMYISVQFFFVCLLAMLVFAIAVWRRQKLLGAKIIVVTFAVFALYKIYMTPESHRGIRD